MLHVAAVASRPVGAPPHLEPEYACEPDASQFANGSHVPAACLVGFETDEAADGVGGGMVGRWSGGCYVGWDMGEDWVAVCEKS